MGNEGCWGPRHLSLGERSLQQERSAAPVGGVSCDLYVGTRRSSEEEWQITLSERGIRKGNDRDKTSIEVRGGAEGFPLGHTPGRGIKLVSTAMAWSTKAVQRINTARSGDYGRPTTSERPEQLRKEWGTSTPSDNQRRHGQRGSLWTRSRIAMPTTSIVQQPALARKGGRERPGQGEGAADANPPPPPPHTHTHQRGHPGTQHHVCGLGKDRDGVPTEMLL